MANNHNSDQPNGANGHPTTSERFDSVKDVLIVGGGPVGCLTALKLGQAGINVDIIEKLPVTSDSPRACGYYGAVHFFLNEIGMYDLVRKEGFMTRGLCWRTRPKDDGKGGRELGDMIAIQPLSAPDDTKFELGAGLLNLPQADLNKLFLREALKTGHVQIHFNTELISILENSAGGVVALARDSETGEQKRHRARYLVGTDGARSSARKALGLSFPGHTWPERLISTNVFVKNDTDPLWHTHYVMSQVNYTVVTPLQEPVVGETTLWRYTMAADPEDNRPDQELQSDENILGLYENCMAGPRPLRVQIKDRAVYKIHQRLAPTLRKGNCLLAGDAGHANNPYGALGLNTGMLDADAAAEALIMVLKEGRSPSILEVYSDERRKVFQNFVDPTSTANKLRVHSNSVETAAQDDWFFRMMADPSRLSTKQLQELSRPYFETWRTDMRRRCEGI